MTEIERDLYLKADNIRSEFIASEKRIDEKIHALHTKIDALLAVFDPDFLASIQANAEQGAVVIPARPGRPSLIKLALDEVPALLLITKKEKSS